MTRPAGSEDQPRARAHRQAAQDLRPDGWALRPPYPEAPPTPTSRRSER